MTATPSTTVDATAASDAAPRPGRDVDPPRSLFAGPLWHDDADSYREGLRRDLATDVAPLIPAAEAARRFPSEAIRLIGERGHFARRWSHPDPHGDLGAATIFAHELGRLLAGGLAAAVSLHMDSTLTILRTSFADTRFARALADDALAGRQQLCVGVSEPASGSDPARFLTRAEEQDDGSWVIEGSKTFISGATTAGHAFVLARTGDAPHHFTFFAVPRGEGGYRVTREMGKHGTHSVETCELEIPGVRLPADHVLGRPGSGLGVFVRAMTSERLSVCGQLVGGLEACLELARAYLRSRPAGPGTLWDFQALRHRFADLLAEQKVLGDAVLATANALQHGRAGQRDVAALKLVVAPRVERAVSDVLQLFGGIAYLDDLPIERALRDVRLARIAAGTDDIMREIVAAISVPEEALHQLVTFDETTGRATVATVPVGDS